MELGDLMKTYYFDLRGGVPTRDRSGVQFATHSEAIAHSRLVARKIRDDKRLRRADLCVAVVEESGAEIHREEVFASGVPV
jgi:hypothetical protein